MLRDFAILLQYLERVYLLHQHYFKITPMQTIDLTTLSGQQLASQLIYLGWAIVKFESDSITLQSPTYENA